MSGPETVNTVAPYAAAEIDLRFIQQGDREASLNEIRKVAEDCRIKGTSAAVTIKGQFLPLEETQYSRRLFEIYRSAANELGIELQGEFTGGCADSGFASAQGVPTLCGIGAVGGKPRTPDEYIELNTLSNRAKVLALAICRLNADHSTIDMPRSIASFVRGADTLKMV